MLINVKSSKQVDTNYPKVAIIILNWNGCIHRDIIVKNSDGFTLDMPL